MPRLRGAQQAAPEVPKDIASDFNEASAVLDLSPKASAALSRRVLQQVLVDHGNAKKKDLAAQIQEVLDGKLLPEYLAKQIDMVRNVGNFAAHPIKSTQTGDIVAVEPGEAEATLATVESLFDFFFVAPARQAARLSSYNQKLASAGKPTLKQP